MAVSFGPSRGGGGYGNITSPMKTGQGGRKQPMQAGKVTPFAGGGIRQSSINPTGNPNYRGWGSNASLGGSGSGGSSPFSGLGGLFGGGGGGGSIGPQSQAFNNPNANFQFSNQTSAFNPQAITSQIQSSPQSLESYGGLKAFNESLAGKYNPLIEGAMQRSRDLTAGEMAAASENAGQRGGGGAGLESLLRTRASAAGAQRTEGVGQAMTREALQTELQGRSKQADVSGEMDRWRTGQLGALTNLWGTGANLDLARARLQQEGMNSQMDQQFRLADLWLRASQPQYYAG